MNTREKLYDKFRGMSKHEIINYIISLDKDKFIELYMISLDVLLQFSREKIAYYSILSATGNPEAPDMEEMNTELSILNGVIDVMQKEQLMIPRNEVNTPNMEISEKEKDFKVIRRG